MNKYNPKYIHNPVNFIVGQKIVIFNSQNQILFLKRSDKCSRPGGWDFPGGGLENEQPITGIIREVNEETNIEIAHIIPVDSITHFSKNPLLLIGYIADYKSGEIELSWEHDDFKWLSIQNAKNLNLPTFHRKLLLKAIDLINHKQQKP